MGGRLCHNLWLLLLLREAGGLTILDPATGPSRELLSTTFHFLGPERFETVNVSAALVVALEAEELREYCRGRRSDAKLEAAFGDAVVVYSLMESECSPADTYAMLDGAGARAVVTIEGFAVPGSLVFAHSGGGDYGGTTPFLAVGSCAPEQQGPGSPPGGPEAWLECVGATAPGARLVLMPTANRWRELFEDPFCVFYARIMLPLALWSAALVAWRVRLARAREPGGEDSHTVWLLCTLEAGYSSVYGAVMALGGGPVLSAPLLSIELQFFFAPGMWGFNTFTTLLLAAHFTVENPAKQGGVADRAARKDALWRRHRGVLALMAAATVGVQLVTCAAHAAFRLATARVLAIAAAFVVAHVLSFVFFLYVACSRGFSLLTALSLVRGAKRGEFLLYVYFLFAAAVLQLVQ